MIDEDILEVEQKREGFSLATVAEVNASGVTLILDGADESGGKEYKCNSCVLFKPGDRVKIHEDSGTIIVEFPIGAPGSRYPLPAGGAKGNVLSKASTTDYDVEWTTPGAKQLAYSSTIAIEFTGSSVLQPINSSTKPCLGSSSTNKQWKDIYTAGGTLSFDCTKLGFFGTSPISKQTLSNSATVAQVITALKNYGLFT